MAVVLFVDDDPEQLTVWSLLLCASGHQVHNATTAAQAEQMLAASPADVIIADLRLPKLTDGLRLIRAAHERGAKVVVLSGWPSDLDGHPEEQAVSRVFVKPVRPYELLNAIRELAMVLCLFLAAAGGLWAQTFRFSAAAGEELAVELDMSSPGSDWGQPGNEAALATLSVDGRVAQHVMLFAGAERHAYPVFLASLAGGEHELTIGRNARYSARNSELKVWNVRFRRVPRTDPHYAALAHAPILYARADTVGGFSDVPLIAYCERLVENGRPLLQYTTIFSNEDGGTSTRALMARWGRTTDIEYIYRAWLDSAGEVDRATIQAKDHKEIEFRGRRVGGHPVLIPSTRNNMVAAEGTSAIRYQIAPVEADLAGHSREQVMDEHPWSYRVMAQELARESKLRKFGTVEGENISDPRNYLYLEARLANRDGAVAALVRLGGERIWRASGLGRADYAIGRDGWVRTTIELPPGTDAGAIQEIAFECSVAPAKQMPLTGTCGIEELSKIFLLDNDYRPGASLWNLAQPVSLPAGQIWTARLGREQH